MAWEDAGWISGKARYLPKVHGRRQGPSKKGLYAILRVTISCRGRRCQLQTLAENNPFKANAVARERLIAMRPRSLVFARVAPKRGEERSR